MNETFVCYEVTGVCRDGKRFKKTNLTAFHARCINLWQGTKWGVRADGTRKKLAEVFN